MSRSTSGPGPVAAPLALDLASLGASQSCEPKSSLGVRIREVEEGVSSAIGDTPAVCGNSHIAPGYVNRQRGDEWSAGQETPDARELPWSQFQSGADRGREPELTIALRLLTAFER